MYDKESFKIKIKMLESLCSFCKSDFETHLKLSSLLSLRYFITSHVSERHHKAFFSSLVGIFCSKEQEKVVISLPKKPYKPQSPPEEKPLKIGGAAKYALKSE